MKKLYALFMAIMVGIASGYADVTYTIKGYNGGTLNENYKFLTYDSNGDEVTQSIVALKVNMGGGKNIRYCSSGC